MFSDSAGSYLIIWQYVIQKQHQALFEEVYGKSGKWSQLFRQSTHYRGSSLIKSTKKPITYLLIDCWTDKQAYEIFKRNNKDIYAQWSKQFKSFYQHELQLGTYLEI